jgi:RNA polymerase sigma-70 factor (ECF subfamily)
MDTDKLLDRVVQGDSSAAETLLARNRKRLHRMVSIHMDRRLAARFDPSDIVQDAIAEAHRRLPEYAEKRPMAFYPWLRRIATDRLLQMYRHHVRAQRRSVLREDPFPLSEDSQMELAKQFGDATSADRLVRSEVRERVRRAIGELRPAEREVIVLKHLEELSFEDAAAVLEISVSAVHSRYYRAIKKLHKLLQEG